MITIIAFIIILSILIFVHELGHFIVAKRSGITVEEFAIGFPPRMVKLWQEEGKITLDGKPYIIGRNVSVPRSIQPGTNVYAETTIDEKGRPLVTSLQPAETEQEKKQSDKGGSEARFFGLFTPRRGRPEPEVAAPTITVDALTRPTEYSINWIPLGGYVRMVGEEDPSDPGSFARKSKRIRLAVLAAGSIMNLITAVFFFTLTSMSGVPERAVGTFITEVVPNSPAAEANLQEDDIIVGADGVEFKYEGDLIEYIDEVKGQEVNLSLERDGQIVQAPITPRADPPAGQGPMGVIIRYAPVAKIIVKDVLPNSPAAEAGLQPGDVIVGADNVTFKYADDLARYIDETGGAEITLTLDRGGQIVNTNITPRVDPPEGQGELGVELDFDLDTKINYYSLPQAFVRGVLQTAQGLWLPFEVIKEVFRQNLPAEVARPTGPIGIYQQTESAVEAAVSLNWWFPLLWWTAVLSTALAITNLLPLPALDGGRILFVLIEAIRGKRVAPEKEGAIHFIGLALLLTLMLVISYYDVSNPIPTIDWANLF